MNQYEESMYEANIPHCPICGNRLSMDEWAMDMELCTQCEEEQNQI